MIGLSLAECIRDIYKRQVLPEEVEMIISGTRVIHHYDWEPIIERYKKIFWKGPGICPEGCEGIFRELLAQGKINQTVITQGRLPKRAGGWVKSLEGLEWHQK